MTGFSIPSPAPGPVIAFEPELEEGRYGDFLSRFVGDQSQERGGAAMASHQSSAPRALRGIGYGQALTPELIIYMAQRQLQEMDIQIGNTIQLLEQNRLEADDLGRQILSYRDLLNTLRGSGAFEDGKLKADQLNDADCAALRRDMGLRTAAELLSHLPTDAQMRDFTPEQRQAVADARRQISEKSHGRAADTDIGELLDDEEMETMFRVAMRHEHGIEIPGGNDIDLKVIDDKIQALTEEQRLVNSENEMMMVQLQSRMQQRTQIIQLASNMLKSLDEGLDTVIGNMR